MPFHRVIRRHILERDEYTCQDAECDFPPRQFFLTGAIFELTGRIIKNGGYMLQAAHYEPRDYKGVYDYHAYNDDGSERGGAFCTLCHIEQEMGITGEDNAKMLALNQTIRTYTWMRANGYEDDDVPFGIFLSGETIDLNNQRRERLEQILICRMGILINK